MLAHQDGLATNLGRVCGKHRRNQRHIEKLADLRFVNPGIAQPVQCIGHATFTRRRTQKLVRTTAADMVLVLGNIGQMQEIAECAHHRDHRIARQAAQKGIELGAFGRIVIQVRSMTQPDGGLPDMLDERKAVFAFAITHDVAEQPAKQTDIFSER